MADLMRREMRLPSTVLVTCLLASIGVCQIIGNWDGEVYGTVQIRVIEEKTGQAICGARVWLLTTMARAAYMVASRDREGFAKTNGPIERFGSRVFTDGDGRVEIWTPFDAGGDILADGSRTTRRFVRGIVIVEDSRFERFESELEPLLQEEVKSDDTAPISMTIKMKGRANQPQQGTPGTVPSSSAEPEVRRP